MAIFTYANAANSNDPIWYGTVTARSGSSVTWSAGGNSTVFGGIFKFTSGGILSGGTITDIHQTVGGIAHLTVSGLAVPLSYQTNWNLAHQADYLQKFFAGDDVINGSAQADVLNGFGGNDTIHAGLGNDTIYAGGFDHIDGGAGNDVIYCNGCATVDGGAGDDTYYATGTSVVYAEAANAGVDTIYSTYTQTVGANIENIFLTGTTNSAIVGGSTANTITGNSGNNFLCGNGGDDTVSGGAGKDTIEGGAGHDMLTGGLGNDGFYFDVAASAANTDVITDFSKVAGNMDRIELDFDVFRIGGAGGHGLKLTEFWDQSHAAPGADYRVMYNPATGVLSYDADGAKAVYAPVQIATIGTTTHPTLAFGDFYITY